MSQVDTVGFGNQAEEVAISVKAPGSPGLNDFEVGLVTAIKELGAGLAVGAFVEEFDGGGAVPFSVYDGNGLRRDDAFDLEAGF